jgi:hypothetical protein
VLRTQLCWKLCSNSLFSSISWCCWIETWSCSWRNKVVILQQFGRLWKINLLLW